MKKSIYSLFLLLVCVACSSTKLPEKKPYKVLQDTEHWKIDTLSTGMIWYQYANYYAPSQAKQLVNILEIDYLSPAFDLDIVYDQVADSLSSFATKHHAIAGINGGYFESLVTYARTNHDTHLRVELPTDTVLYWKHEGALVYDRDNKDLRIIYGDNTVYDKQTHSDVLSCAPVLIYNSKAVGVDFADTKGMDLKKMHYEDYRRHQGSKHPRTAMAITSNNKLLLITVDGRFDSSKGMTAKELTLFIDQYFKPTYALNLDGGGSTSMWIKERGSEDCHIVNYPTDNKKQDHYGQRKVNTVLLIKTHESITK